MNQECVPYRPLLTERLLLGLPLQEDLSRHLDTCAGCRGAAVETGDVVRTLRRATSGAGGAPLRSSGTLERTHSDHGGQVRRRPPGARRTRPRRLALGAAAVLVTAAAISVPLTFGHGQEPAHDVTLVRQGRMIERPWGTEVPVVLSGLRAGEAYRMMAVNADGTRLSGGSVRATDGEPLDLRMVTAMRRDTITALMVEDEDGRVVSHVRVRPPVSG